MTNAGRYRLLRTLGVGGMAQVVEAVAIGEAGFERRVAVKWMRPEMVDDDGMRRMFLDEARIASRLHHANIVQVLDYGLMDGTEFLVSELVDGLDLGRARTLSGGTLPEAVALHVVAEVAHGLEHAHRATDSAGQPLGIVHRDVSPGNVLLSWGGDVKLGDFGIAFASQREERTATGLVKGKASYMAPEQARGEPVTGAADIYALGVTLHVTLTGQTPSRFGQRLEADPAPLTDDVRELIDRCLAAEPEERPSARAVAEVAERLRRTRSHETGRSRLAAALDPLRERAAEPRGIDRLVGFVVTRTGETAERAFTLTEAPRAPRGRRGVIAAWVLVALLSIGIAAWRLSPQAPAAPPVAPVVEPTLRDAGPEPSPPDARPVPDPVLPEPPRPRRRARRRPSPAVEAPGRAATRAVQVVGATVFRHRVQIDGQSRGYAPTRALPLSLGTHRIVVLDRDTGAPILERTLTLSADSPAVTRVP